MPDFDLVILGAGPAGTAAAREARRLGLTAALVDKAVFPRPKLCGGLVTGRCAAHLAEIFGIEITPDLFETRRNFEFHLRDQPLGTLEDVPPLHLTMRWDFDHRLLQEAFAAGAADYTGHRVETHDLTADRLTLASGETLAYRLLIAADGVQSPTAKALFGQPFSRDTIGFALEVEAPSQAPTEATPIRIDFAAADWGYGWSFPKKHSTTIGLGGLHARNPQMKAHLSAYLARLGTGQSATVKGHFLPFGAPKPTPGKGNVLLVGDAAGLVDPITGEGIGHAIHSGALAARAAKTALDQADAGRALALYTKATQPIRRAIAQARILRPLIFSARLQPFFARTFAASQTLKRDYMHLLSGDMEYPALLRRTALRLPRAAIRYLSAAASRN
ncbi:Putative oxidoreductase [Roseovarius sp. THAF8]|uniref:geranylgeranyl reductase family protein n=1 Tax=Roseovarius sp. THAF8 TaxID=2587846 RepID=UPI0012679EF8|nr:geranylgeranyl reductase family protein [Roseovarius sp. THAF8]QFT98911.1 Putative oxidoreductase [Roseovarius sp. THAF8]